MNLRFDPERGLIIVPVRIFGSEREMIVRFALDTGATGSLINTDLAVSCGYDPAASSERIQITTGSGIVYAARITVDEIHALGKVRQKFPLLCHTLPPSASVDGLLGLDFFREAILKIDLQIGTVSVT